MEIFDNGDGASEQGTIEEGAVDSSEAAFMHGYNADGDNVKECEECGGSIQEDEVSKEIEGEVHIFCSKTCAEEFTESYASV